MLTHIFNQPITKIQRITLSIIVHIQIRIPEANIYEITLFSILFWACFSWEAKDTVTAVELDKAHRKAEIGIQPFAQINFDKKYQTNQIQDIKRTNNQTLKRFISEKIANSNQLVSSSNFDQISKSEIGLLGKIGSTAPEKTSSWMEANHSFIFNELTKSSIWVLKVLTPVITIVIIIPIAENQNQISTQIRKTRIAESSAVIQGLLSLNVQEAWDIASKIKTESNNRAGM